MQPKIIGISGKKQSGKTTLANFLQAYIWAKNQKTFYSSLMKVEQEEDGAVYILDKDSPNICDANKWTGDYNLTKNYSFADSLKEFCIYTLGLSYNQCYGSDEDKNSFTQYRWDKMPFIISLKYKNFLSLKSKQKYMTAREVMQVFGTDIMRKYFDDRIWVNATFNKIKKDNTYCAIISDVRFKSEVDMLIRNNAYIIRLNRAIGNDAHSSETDLDDYPFDHFSNAFVLDNSNLNINGKNETVIHWLESEGVI